MGVLRLGRTGGPLIAYQTLFEYFRGGAEEWAAVDTDARLAPDNQTPALTANEIAEFVGEFCSRAGRHVEEIGPDAVGDVISCLMGSDEAVWWKVVEASHERARDAIMSLRYLYEHCFAVHLDDWSGQGRGGALAEACYMLWDMDGGLESIPMFEKPQVHVPACYAVLEHALTLNSPACWESALHGLGHIAAFEHEPTQSVIDGFLANKGHQIPEDLRAYALCAREGCVQ